MCSCLGDESQHLTDSAKGKKELHLTDRLNPSDSLFSHFSSCLDARFPWLWVAATAGPSRSQTNGAHVGGGRPRTCGSFGTEAKVNGNGLSGEDLTETQHDAVDEGKEEVDGEAAGDEVQLALRRHGHGKALRVENGSPR